MERRKGKERIRKKKKGQSQQTRAFPGVWDVLCFCSLFFGARGVPARERGSLLFLPFDTTSCHGCLLVLFVFRTPPRVAAAETWRASKMNNDCTFHCCLSLHRRPVLVVLLVVAGRKLSPLFKRLIFRGSFSCCVDTLPLFFFLLKKILKNRFSFSLVFAAC